MTNETGIWRFHSDRIEKLISGEFAFMDFTALGVANHMTVAGWPSALLDEEVDRNVAETTPEWALRLADELRSRPYRNEEIDSESPITEVDVWTAFWRAVEYNAIPAGPFRVLQLESELQQRFGSAEMEEIPELAGASEIADMCRVEELEVLRWIEAGELPAPALTISEMPIWERAVAENWARLNGRLRND